MSGLEVAEQVKAQRPWTPVVIITGYGTDAAEARAKAAGVSGFVHKPLSPEMIEDSARGALAAPVIATNVVVLPFAAEAPKAETAGIGSGLKNIALFFAAPFIGLAYIALFPFVGLGALAVLAVRAAMKFEAARTAARMLKNVGLLMAAPFIGLAYVVVFPFLGLAALAFLGGRAAMGRLRGE
jgi:CheY-like chemotaxis protein